MSRPSPQTDRVIALLNFLASNEDRGFSLSELSRVLKVHKVSLYPMLASLTDAGFIIRHPITKQFQLGASVIAIGEAAARSLPVLEACRASLQALYEELGLPCAIGMISENFGTLIDRRGDLPAQEPQMRRGQKVPLAFPFGSSAVAWRDDAAIRKWMQLEESDPIAPQITAALNFIRETGYAVELQPLSAEYIMGLIDELKDHVLPNEERALLDRISKGVSNREVIILDEIGKKSSYHVAVINAPIFGRNGNVEFVLMATVAKLITREEVARIGKSILAKTQEVSRLLRGPEIGSLAPSPPP